MNEVTKKRWPVRPYIVLEEQSPAKPDDSGLVALALVWARNAADALGYLIGDADCELCGGPRYELHSGTMRLVASVNMNGERRSFRVRLTPDAPVPPFVLDAA